MYKMCTSEYIKIPKDLCEAVTVYSKVFLSRMFPHNFSRKPPIEHSSRQDWFYFTDYHFKFVFIDLAPKTTKNYQNLQSSI